MFLLSCLTVLNICYIFPQFILGLLKAKIGDVIPAVSTLLKTCSDSEMLEHTLSLLTALLQHHLADMKKHHGVNAILKETLVEIQSRLSPNEHKVIQFLFWIVPNSYKFYYNIVSHCRMNLTNSSKSFRDFQMCNPLSYYIPYM